MRMLKIVTGFLVVCASQTSAKDGAAWVLTQKTGDVRVVRNGLQPASLEIRSSLAPGDVIATGPSGRAMLTNGNDYVVVAPASRLVLPKEQQQTGFTRLVQQVGTLLYKVKHTGVPHFEVQTPFLAAVVKGTSFTIVVDQDRAAVQVTDGVVEVDSAVGGASRLVERGATVYIGRARPDAIIEMKPTENLLPPGTDGQAIKIRGNGDVPLSVLTSLTDGLIKASPTPSPAAIVVQAVAANPAALLHAEATAPATTTVSSAASAVTVSAASATVPATAGQVTPSVSSPTISASLAAPIATASVSTPVVAANVSAPSISATVAAPTVAATLAAPSVTAAVTAPTVSATIVAPTVSTTLVTPTVTTSVATVPSVTATVSLPSATAPTITPTVVTPSVGTPTMTTPTITASVSVPSITTPTLAVSAPNTPTVAAPVVTVPSVTVPSVTVPAVTVPAVTVPSVTVPAVAVPGVTVGH